MWLSPPCPPVLFFNCILQRPFRLFGPLVLCRISGRRKLLKRLGVCIHTDLGSLDDRVNIVTGLDGAARVSIGHCLKRSVRCRSSGTLRQSVSLRVVSRGITALKGGAVRTSWTFIVFILQYCHGKAWATAISYYSVHMKGQREAESAGSDEAGISGPYHLLVSPPGARAGSNAR